MAAIPSGPGVLCTDSDNPAPRSRLLTLDGWGHTSEGKSSCVDAHINRYLLTIRVPPPGTACRPDLVPFARP
jgi:TAP-like protein